jgi:hypothetical protein
VTAGSQRYPAIASDAHGNFVVVWESPDGSGSGIFGQRYDSSGGALGTEFRVNSVTLTSQTDVSVASDTEGDFVVVWESSHVGEDGEIFGQRYDSTGRPLGGEFRVNTLTSGFQITPSVASDASGNFVVAWASDDYYANGRVGIFGKQYDDDGAPQADDFLASQANVRSRSPSVASAASGNFVVVWNRWGYFTNDEIYGRRFDATGLPQGGVFHVNTDTSGYQLSPSVSSGANGNFVVAWDDYKLDEFNREVFGRRYDRAGVGQGDQFQINSFTSGYQRSPSVGATGPSQFVVVWRSQEQDGDGYGVFGKRYRREPRHERAVADPLVTEDRVDAGPR